jgi:hypothetical protein
MFDRLVGPSCFGQLGHSLEEPGRRLSRVQRQVGNVAFRLEDVSRSGDGKARQPHRNLRTSPQDIQRQAASCTGGGPGGREHGRAGHCRISVDLQYSIVGAAIIVTGH